MIRGAWGPFPFLRPRLRGIFFNSTQTQGQFHSSDQSRGRDGRRREEAPDDAEPLRRSVRGGGRRSWFRARIQSPAHAVSLGMILSFIARYITLLFVFFFLNAITNWSIDPSRSRCRKIWRLGDLRDCCQSSDWLLSEAFRSVSFSVDCYYGFHPQVLG